MPLDGGMTLLQRQIPFRQAMGMMFTGQRIKAQRALELGLINEVVPRAELDTAVARWSAAILACAPLSLKAIKQVVRQTATLVAGAGPGGAPAGAGGRAAVRGCRRGRARVPAEEEAPVARALRTAS